MTSTARAAGEVMGRRDEWTRTTTAREGLKPVAPAFETVPHAVVVDDPGVPMDDSPIEAGVDVAIERASTSLAALQREDGHWVFELEADATIPAEYVLMTHYLGETPSPLEPKIAAYLRRIRIPGGGWPLHQGGEFNVSATVKAYFALKMIGDDPQAPHMREAREAVLAHGGAETANVFTRILLALYGVITWPAVPVMPVEIMFLPTSFPIGLSRISYWGRTVLVPLLVLMAMKPKARNPRGVGIDELFKGDPKKVRQPHRAPHQSRMWFSVFEAIDNTLRLVEPFFPKAFRRRAIDKAVAFVRERLNGESGLGAIFPAMANAVMMFDALGVPRTDPEVATARRAIDLLLVEHGDEAYCQPCVSPVWDTALAGHAQLEVGTPAAVAGAARGLDWLKGRQVLDVRGDWIDRRPHVRPGGWAFQYDNPHYPDLDDTAAVVLAMHRHVRDDADSAATYDTTIERATEWVLGLQSHNGGWGAFDADNTQEYLNNIPFADHGALLDPPTSDVTARCVGMLAQMGRPEHRPALERGLAFLAREQRDDGAWYGRWGMNYIYGTWSVLSTLRIAKADLDGDMVRRASAWLVGIQNPDGGWGEDTISYELDARRHRPAPSTASQTAWALLGLMAAGDADHPAVERGVRYLMATQGRDGFWAEPEFTATGFPRVFYLRYHGYPKFFPLWALARYRRLRGTPRADLGIAL